MYTISIFIRCVDLRLIEHDDAMVRYFLTEVIGEKQETVLATDKCSGRYQFLKIVQRQDSFDQLKRDYSFTYELIGNDLPRIYKTTLCCSKERTERNALQAEVTHAKHINGYCDDAQHEHNQIGEDKRGHQVI